MAKCCAPTLSTISGSGHSGLQIRKASNSEIPDKCLQTWRKLYIPTLLQHLGTVTNPWDLTTFIEKAQELYDKFFPFSPHDLTRKGDHRAQLVSLFF